MHLELKTQQPGLPEAVAELIKRHGWDLTHGHTAPADAAAAASGTAESPGPSAAASGGARAAATAEPERPAPQAAAAAAASPGAGGLGAGASGAAAAGREGDAGAALGEVPGVTITSFHLEQLRRSKEVGSRPSRLRNGVHCLLRALAGGGALQRTGQRGGRALPHRA